MEVTEFLPSDFSLVCFFLLGVVMYLYRKWMSGGWCYEETLLTGKTAVITGSNTGIGKEAARNFVERGARVILACRNLEKAYEAAAEIKAAGPGTVVVRHLDLASFKSIKKFAKEILDREPRIDILVNNAGIMCAKGFSDDGFDLCFASNYLGHFLLTNLLLDRLKESAPSRIINLSSLVHKEKGAKIHWNDINLNQPGSYAVKKAYQQTKLAMVLFSKELAKRLKGVNVNVHAVNPGIASSEIIRFIPNDYLQLIASLGMSLVFKNTIQAAQTTVYCSVSKEVENQSGEYYSDCHIDDVNTAEINEESSIKLWDLSMKMISGENLK